MIDAPQLTVAHYLQAGAAQQNPQPGEPAATSAGDGGPTGWDPAPLLECGPLTHVPGLGFFAPSAEYAFASSHGDPRKRNPVIARAA